MRIPLVWPDGTFGLPKPKTGCPVQKDVNFAAGWRFQDTEDANPDNSWSKSLNLAGSYKKNDIKTEYCMKTTYKSTNAYHIGGWPKGFYCLFKYGNCPKGFSKGWIFWDDEDHQSWNKKGGTLPNGAYDINTKIEYCCRKDEPNGYTWPISLPTSKPFYLLRIGGYCQVVRGMKVTEEWVRWDNEFWANKDKSDGVTPDFTKASHYIKLYYCYYYH